MFTSAPVLTMPDPQLQFIVEVDASNEGVGVSAIMMWGTGSSWRPDRVVGVVIWQIENEVQQASCDEPVQEGCPLNWLFVPEAMRVRKSSTGHTPHCSHVIQDLRTVFVIQQRFWWPNLAMDVAEYIAACSVCARSKASRQVRMGLLQPATTGATQTKVTYHVGLRHGLPASV
ncbi:hypothetical protein L3Q82_006831 [Scortum barcoo]|uniref:Uncharacterized protein n=1 Tax=Scortum barcoo TaxID=214431 RepID=A0ACB8WVA7_9TELE|nr:hypothetical protein L3Q82_006831 [Scortum barcoo]